MRRLTAGRRRALLALAVLAAVLFLALALIPDPRQLGAVDAAIRALMKQSERAALDRPMQILTVVGSGTVLVPVGAVLLAVIWRRHRRLAVQLAGAAAVAAAASTFAKWLIARPRPRLRPYSFPSGHTVSVVVFFGLLIYVLWALGLPRPVRWAVIAAGGVATIGVAISRVYLGAHWFTDVAGGVAGGVAFVLLAVLYLDRQTHRASSR